MTQHTDLYSEHINANATMVDFFGWQLPLHYGSQLKEHLAVRQAVGMFDVSHMAIVDCVGTDAKTFLRYLLANDVARLQSNRALYTCMLNETGGVLDDLIVYYQDDTHYRLVLNAATREKDWLWLVTHAENFAVTLTPQTDFAMIAVQGPKAFSALTTVLPEMDPGAFRPFSWVAYQDWTIAFTGYTGEQGVEIILPNTQVLSVWQVLLEAGAQPCGLGARDSLRIEAGFNLYGQDMDEQTSPLVSNLAWTVSFHDPDRSFIGKTALEQEKVSGVETKLAGILLADKAMLRAGQVVDCGAFGEGIVTSGTYSPLLEKPIGFVRLPNQLVDSASVNIRNKTFLAKIVDLPFVKQGQVRVK